MLPFVHTSYFSRSLVSVGYARYADGHAGHAGHAGYAGYEADDVYYPRCFRRRRWYDGCGRSCADDGYAWRKSHDDWS